MLFMFGRRDRAGLVLVLYQGVYCSVYTGVAERFQQQSVAKWALGPNRGKEDSSNLAERIWKRRLRRCTV
jgi:hypothetical protein